MKRLGLVFLALLTMSAQSRDAVIDQTIATLLRVQTFESVAISPDGSKVAYVKTVRGANGEKTDECGAYVQPVKGGAATHISVKNNTEVTRVAWSPDGSHLAVLGDQLYVDGKPLTTGSNAMTMPRWSPDGKSIAVLAIMNASRKGGALEAMTPPSGDVETQVEEQRIAVIDIATKALTLATPDNMYIYDYDWSPDSKNFVAEAAFGAGEDNYWVAQLRRFDQGDTKGRSIYTPSLQIASPRWSPDGKSIAFIEGLMSDEGNTGGDVFLIPATGGAAPTNLTPNLKASVTTIQWVSPDKIFAGEIVNGLSGFAAITTAGNVTQMWSGEGKLDAAELVGLSLARDNMTTAAAFESFQEAPEVVAGKIGEWEKVTHVNESVKPLWGTSRNVNWMSDGYRVQGWLLYPRERKASLPMVVQVHGGPSSGAVSAWPNLNLASLVANGYAVLLPNPRGSYGQGEAFTAANVKDFGYGDLRDILRGVDAAVALTSSSPIDKDRVGVWGWSYGGYMTMWAVTQTNRFKAAVAGAGIVNWQSYYGQNSINTWMVPFFGATVYDDPFIYARSSPISFIKNVKTPTLVLVGDRDGEVPAPQSFEFWRALRTLGVKTKLVVYPNEGHRFANPEHRRDVARRIVMWFDENL